MTPIFNPDAPSEVGPTTPIVRVGLIGGRGSIPRGLPRSNLKKGMILRSLLRSSSGWGITGSASGGTGTFGGTASGTVSTGGTSGTVGVGYGVGGGTTVTVGYTGQITSW